MVSLRDRTKRAASPEDDSKPDLPKKKQRGGKKQMQPAQPESEDEPQPPKKRGRAVAKSQAQPASDDDADAAAQCAPNGNPKKAGGKAKATPADSNGAAGDDETFKKDSKLGKTTFQVADGQYAKARNLFIPVDEACPLASYHVYVDDSDGIIYDASLNQTNAGANNNKFYRIQLLTDGRQFRTWTRWGRVGDHGQSASLGNGSLDDALSQFFKKFKDKSGLSWENRGQEPKAKKYVFIERSYEPDTSEDESDDRPDPADRKAGRSRSTSPAKCTLQPQVKSLMELIFNQSHIDSVMADMGYDAAKLPLGKLSTATILRGYQALKDLAALFDDQSLAETKYENSYAAATEQLSNRYYSYIPHDFRRNRPPVIDNHTLLTKEVELLESLTDLKDTDTILKGDKGGAGTVHILDSRFNGLGLQETTPVDRTSNEFICINDYLTNTRGATHGIKYELLDIFRIERLGESDRFEKAYGNVAGDRRLLWHGSRSTNYGGILSQGLRIAPPEAPVSGYMFGKGIYLADMSSKSAIYCVSYASGGHALLLLCEAELGNPMQTLTNASYSAGDDALAKGLHSTWGQGLTGPSVWKDAACVHPSLKGVKMPDTTTALPGNTNIPNASLQYNEYICYNVAQVRLRYLLRVKMN